MPKKEIVQVNPAAPNPNLSPATNFGNLVFVAGQTGRHPVTGEVGKDIREQTRNVLERIKQILTAAGTSMDNVLTATLPNQRIFVLEPVRGNTFSVKDENGLTLDFKRDTGGAVTEFSMNQAGSSSVYKKVK